MKVALQTLGCKLNYAETSSVADQFRSNGFTVSDISNINDVIVINSCSVTDNADKECRRIIRKALKLNPNAFIIVTGCYAQLKPEEIASIGGVDLVVGSSEKFNLFNYENKFKKLNTPKIHVGDISIEDSFGIAFSSENDARTRAFLKVQDGCDYNCSFCTIPLARGGSRSQSIINAFEQAQSLVTNGYKELVITGVNVGDFGKNSNENFYDLLLKLHDVEGLERIRISSIEPNLLSDDIIKLASKSDRLLPHFHLPLQSGSNEILGKMKRRYKVENYCDRVNYIKNMIPNCAIGVDVIVGFPSETEVNFNETFTFLNDIDVSYFHVFTYSERENTPAASLGNPVPVNIRRERTSRLRILSEMKKFDFIKKNLNKTYKVLFENAIPNEENIIYGWSENYIRVGVPLDLNLDNEIVETKLNSFNGRFCEGSIANFERNSNNKLFLPVLNFS